MISLTVEPEYVVQEEQLGESKIVEFNGMKLNVSIDGANVDIRAMVGDRQLGYVVFDRDGNTVVPLDLSVDERYQGQGIAKTMYDYVKSLGFRLEASPDQTEAGKGFWEKHRGEERVWEEHSSESISEESKAAKYNGLVMKYAFNQSALILKAFKQGIPIAFVKFIKENKELYPQNLWTHDDYRNRGVAKSMYDFLKSEGYIINRSHDQTKAGAGFWDKHRGEDEYVWEEIIDEMPLPADWDPQQMRQQGTTFKSRLAYALERAKKLGTGSSRVATIIEYQGRPTVLKIAKNAKGLAQNSVEADILSDGYASQLGILIPIIDYDEQNREPSWVHTEMAQKATEKQLCSIMKCKNLGQLVQLAQGITGRKSFTYQDVERRMRQDGISEADIETATEYANTLADLNSSFDVELGDFARAANWGLYQGKPVVIDVGFNSNVLNQYYSR